jgi:hypothetical protein
LVGFAWEVLEVYSGPPQVTFTWRHFGRMTDYFSCPGLSGLVYKVDPTNRMVKIFGMCKATVNEHFQIQDLQIFYDPNQLFTQLTEVCPFAPFIKLPDAHPPEKRSLNQKEMNKEKIGSGKKMNFEELHGKLLSNPQSIACNIL